MHVAIRLILFILARICDNELHGIRQREPYSVCGLLCWHTLIELSIEQGNASVRSIMEPPFAPAAHWFISLLLAYMSTILVRGHGGLSIIHTHELSAGLL